MARFLALHTADPRLFATDPSFALQRKILRALTSEAWCIRTFLAAGAGKIACEWEASSEQALIDAIAKVPEIPVDGIYPMRVIEWEDVKRQLGE